MRRSERPAGVQQAVLAHQPLHPLAIDPLTKVAAGQGGDHPVAVERVLSRNAEDRLLGARQARRWPFGGRLGRR